LVGIEPHPVGIYEDLDSGGNESFLVVLDKNAIRPPGLEPGTFGLGNL